MTDIIHLLPESIANQIAAGEVVQRPSSVVKELIENAIDAESTEVKIIVREAGKNLIHVIDNGSGMSITDARMSFERHATSKINNADDLFRLRTMGFRGEALASIAAVAQVELKTRRESDKIGTLIRIEGSRVVEQEPEACLAGTSIEVKNLFFNVPARRNFLKSNSVEMRHIIDEFQRAALSFPDTVFQLYQNDMEVYNLPPGKLVRRIVNIFGKNYQEQLVACQEDTPHLKVMGYVGKPEFAKKTRGEQFVFVNRRYIRSNYLNHAVQMAYETLMPQDYFPFFVLFLELDPKHIDVNVHPTKTEIKFVDERTIYGVLKSAVKQALGRHNITPSLDFSYNINVDLETRYGGEQSDKTSRDLNYERLRPDKKEFRNIRSWDKLYEGLEKQELPENKEQDQDINNPGSIIIESGLNQNVITGLTGNIPESAGKPLTYQLHGRYILTTVKSGLMIVDQVAAHQRIIYENYLEILTNNSASTQRILFPVTIDLNPADYTLVIDIKDEISALGFDFDLFGKNAIIINGSPPGLKDTNEKEVFEGLIEQYKLNKEKLELNIHENLAMSMARHTSIRSGKLMNEDERKSLINQLFGCKNPNYSPFGDTTFYILKLEQIESYFK